MLESLRHKLGTDRIPSHLSAEDVFATHTYRRARNPLDEKSRVAGHFKCAIELVAIPTLRGRRYEGFSEDITYVAFPLPHAGGMHYAVMLLLVSDIAPGSGYLLPNNESQKLKIVSQKSVSGSETFTKLEALEFMKRVEQGDRLVGFPDARRAGENTTTHWSRPEIQPTGRRRPLKPECEGVVLVRMPRNNTGTIRGVRVHNHPLPPKPLHHLRSQRSPRLR